MAIKITKGSGNVFRDLGFSPAEPEHLRVRAELMLALERWMARRRLTQAKAATLLGVSQPRVSDLVRGRLHRFSIDALVEMLARAGVRVRLITERGARVAIDARTRAPRTPSSPLRWPAMLCPVVGIGHPSGRGGGCHSCRR